jgi:dTDP-4-dehydrorhamnose reductase
MPLGEPEAIRKVLGALDFGVLVNMAALTNVDYCEEHPDEAFSINARAPGELAAICKAKGARIIQLSTDYVFGGDDPGLRTEDEVPSPLGIYGRAKLAGERAVLDAFPGNIVVRTSWVFGPGKPSFPDRILRLARENGKLQAVADKWSCPCYNEDFARWLEMLLGYPEASGIYHLCNSGVCSWHEYATETLAVARELGVPIADAEVEPLAMKDMKRFISPRPVHSALSCGRFTKLTGHVPRPWQDAMREYLLMQTRTIT